MATDKSKNKSGVGRNGASASLGPNSEIGRKLKQYYDELIAEEIPERFTSLLHQLEEKERGSVAKKDSA
jgi:hypothetical protein